MLRIKPTGKQEEVMALPARGHIIVLGTAGSGKTTIALLRAIHLASLPGSEKVLLVTFNVALVKYMTTFCLMTLPKLVIETYHKFARGYLNSIGKMPNSHCIVDPKQRAQYISTAISLVKEQNPAESTLNRPIEFFIDEIAFIERFGFMNLTTYYDAERIGRTGTIIKRENRKWIFEVYKKYKELREVDGYKYDWDDLSAYTYAEFQNDISERRYTHIIIDEGQDFSPMMIKSLVSAMRKNGSFTFFGDVAQQIYGNRLSWRDSGINVERIWRFEINYRNPPSITAFANDLVQSDYWQKNDDMIDAVNHIANGPKPALIKFNTIDSEVNWVVNTASKRGRNSSTVIICRNRSDIKLFMEALKRKNFPVALIDKNTPGYVYDKKIYLTTYHTAKGLEFDNVFIPFLVEGKLPDADSITNAVSVDEAYANEIKLLYVAVTRSKDGLYMSYHGTLSPLFPKGSKNYDSFKEKEAL